MGVLKAINPINWVNKLIDKRIHQYGKGVGNEMKYNPLLVNMRDDDYDKLFTRRTLENSVWFSGDEQALSYFYRKEAPKFYRFGETSESTNYFWKDNQEDFRKVHTGFPQLISDTMSRLLIGNGVRHLVEGDDQEELQEELDALLKDNKFKTLLGSSIVNESWAGGIAWKLTKNPLISEYPIIEAWSPENYTNTVVCGRIVEDIFYTYYKHNNLTYRLSEIYGVAERGAFIDYKLEILQFNEVQNVSVEPTWIRVPLSDLEQTKHLKRIDFIGYMKRLSLYKPNKLPNNEFRSTVLGKSDYAGSYGAFDSIDESWSTIIQEGRDGKLYRYFPEEFMPKNSNGETSFPNDFKTKHVIYSDSPMENTEKAKIQYSQGEIRPEQHLETYKASVMIALNNAGLSPLTVGITGFESIDASAESQQEREKVSIRTRNDKIEVWTEYLNDFLPIALEFHLMTKHMTTSDMKTFKVKKVPEFTIETVFGDYILKSKKDRTSEVTEGFGTTWDVLTGVEYVHQDKTRKEQLAISARIKVENGIESLSKAEASALQDLNLIDEEKLVEDGVELIENEVGQENQNGLDIDENDVEPIEEEIVEEE